MKKEKVNSKTNSSRKIGKEKINQNVIPNSSVTITLDNKNSVDNTIQITNSNTDAINNSNIKLESTPISTLPDQQNQRREELEKVKIRKSQANSFEKYLNDTGITTAFQLILAELIMKKIPNEDHFSYTAGRLRQIGREVDEIKSKNK